MKACAAGFAKELVMTGKKKILLGCVAAALAAAFIAIVALALVIAVPLALWLCQNAPIPDLSEGALPLSFQTRSKELQKELRLLHSEKALPKQSSLKEDESEKLWEGLAALMEKEGMPELIDSMDALLEDSSKEPRYAEGLDLRSSAVQVASYLDFLRFSEAKLAPFKSDAPFKRMESFIASLPKLKAASKANDDESDADDLKELCKLKLLVSLSEGRRLEALKMLESLFSLSRSPLMPGLSGVYCRYDAAGCALALARTPGWTDKELEALQKIVGRERESVPPFAEAIAFERRNALLFYEEERARGGALERSWKSLQELPDRLDSDGLQELGFTYDDIVFELFRDIDKEELQELSLLRALADKGFVPNFKRREFLDSVRQNACLSEEEEKAVHCLITVQSESLAALGALDCALCARLGLPWRKDAVNPMTGKPYHLDEGPERVAVKTWRNGPEAVELPLPKARTRLK